MALLQSITDYHVGDLASIAGVAISLVGFLVTVLSVQRSKAAAFRAEAAANEARRMIRTFETVSDFSAAIALMEEIKRLHRAGQMEIVLDRYASLRKVLIGVRRLAPMLDDDGDSKIQNAVTTLATIEDLVERTKAQGAAPDFVRINRLLSRDIDELHAVLVNMTSVSGETSHDK